VTTDVSDEHAEAFAAVRPRLLGIAYRMLGSVAEADDVVQDAWIRWQGAERVVHASRVPLHGRERVVRAIDANGVPAILATAPGGAPIAMLTSETTDDGIAEILWQVNPRKLARFAVTS